MRLGLPSALAILTFADPASAQEFWAKKPYTEWSQSQCRKILEDSPWARRHIVSRVLVESLSSPSTDRARESNPRIVYTIQFRTAQPVRQAMVREQHAAMNYDSLALEQKASFDKSAETFLNQNFPDTVIVYVEYSSNVPTYQADLERIWATRTEPWAKNEIFLVNDDGEKIPPLRFTRRSTGGAFQMIFPRVWQGKPAVRPEHKEVKLEFPHPTIGILTETRVFEVFKVDRMTVAGKVEY